MRVLLRGGVGLVRTESLLSGLGWAGWLAGVSVVVGFTWALSAYVVSDTERANDAVRAGGLLVLGACMVLTIACLLRREWRTGRERAHRRALATVLAAARCCMLLDPPEQTKALRELAPHVSLLAEASETMEKPEREELRRAMAEALRNEQPLIGGRGKRGQLASLAALGWLGTRSTVWELKRNLHGEDLDRAYVAGQALAEHGSRYAYEALLAGLDSTGLPPSRVAALLEGPRFEGAVEVLSRRVLKGRLPQVHRFWIAYLLGNTGSPGALQALERLLADQDVSVRANAAEALGQLPCRTPIERALRDESWVVRCHAARAAGVAGRHDLAPVLVRLLEDREWWVRQNAMIALKVLGPEIREAVLPALTGSDRFARNKAAEILIDFGYARELVERLRVAGPANVERHVRELARAEATDALHDVALTDLTPAQLEGFHELLEMDA